MIDVVLRANFDPAGPGGHLQGRGIIACPWDVPGAQRKARSVGIHQTSFGLKRSIQDQSNPQFWMCVNAIRPAWSSNMGGNHRSVNSLR